MICPLCQSNALFYPRRVCCSDCGNIKRENGLIERAFYFGVIGRITSENKSPYPKESWLSTVWQAGHKQADIDFFGEKEKKTAESQLSLWE
jgi:hypothetical protein